MSELIKVNGLSKIYNKKQATELIALNNVDLSIEKGEFIAIVGRSGAGKSTLMNILGLLDKASSGEYFLEKNNISKMNDIQLSKIRANQIGYVLQDFGLIESESVYTNVKIPLVFSKFENKLIDKRIKETLSILNIEDLEKKKVSKLSGGQKQRVAIARAIVNHPKIIFADEPTGSLDTYNSEIILSTLTSLNNQGITVVIITHDLAIAKKCKRVITVEDGKIVHDIRNQ